MSNPIVSIIVTNYNYGKFLHRCLRSCFSQKFLDYEVLVIDDFSTDNSIEILQPFLESSDNLKVITNKENLGVAESANLAIKASRGQFFIRVDSDDYVNSEFLQILFSLQNSINVISYLKTKTPPRLLNLKFKDSFFFVWAAGISFSPRSQ